MKRKRNHAPNANIWNTLICPFVNDLLTLVNLRQTCSQLRYVTSSALAACVPIGKYSFAQYTNVCGEYRFASSLFVHYYSMELNSNPPQIRQNLLEWNQKRQQIPQGNWMETDVRCRIKPEHNFLATEHIYLVVAKTMIHVAHNQVSVCYKSNPCKYDHVRMYVFSHQLNIDIHEQLPHSHVTVKCYQGWARENCCEFGLQLFNPKKLNWKLTIAYHDVRMNSDIIKLRTNATEIVFQNWHLDMREDKLHMPNAMVITLDYRCRGNDIFFEPRLLTDLLADFPLLQKIILLCQEDPGINDDRVEVQLQSPLPLVTIEEEYR